MTAPVRRRAGSVVGVDGSDCSKDALRWAARQAELTGATLEAIIAWHYPTFSGLAPANPRELGLSALAEQALADAGIGSWDPGDLTAGAGRRRAR